ncbi:M50 family metallopeptidase [Xanthomonadaceae bacterium JHOS43]|nr:M50 family metallopeptidase [Xanthomonadaceae bacterium JHOS43]MCX7564102.1 M50 family metallopeptidase [Xanthomonadaceae bacterium XH05]
MKHESGQPLSGAVPDDAVDDVQRGRHARLALVIAVAMSLLLVVLPRLWPALGWLAWPQALIATLVHELGHGVAALLSGGGFESLRLYPDGSGVAMTRNSAAGLQRALIAAGGPFGPPLAALGLFIAARRARVARAALALVALVLVLALLMWVRNPFGIGWVALCALVAGLAAWRVSAIAAQALTCFVAVQLCLASLARADYLFSRGASTGAGEFASDTQQIAAHLGGPHWFWGGLILLVATLVMVVGVWVFLRTLRTNR